MKPNKLSRAERLLEEIEGCYYEMDGKRCKCVELIEAALRRAENAALERAIKKCDHVLAWAMDNRKHKKSTKKCVQHWLSVEIGAEECRERIKSLKK